MSKIYTHNWFNPSQFKYFRQYTGENKKYLEVGCFEGRSLCWMFENILTGDGDIAYAVDPFDGVDEREAFDDVSFIEKNFLHNTKEYSEKLTVCKGCSFNQLVKLQEEHSEFFDFIFIDGSHDSWDVISDAILSFNLLKETGIMGFDDYIYGDPGPRSPQVAIDAFLFCFQNFIEVINISSNQVWIKKTASPDSDDDTFY